MVESGVGGVVGAEWCGVWGGCGKCRVAWGVRWWRVVWGVRWVQSGVYCAMGDEGLRQSALLAVLKALAQCAKGGVHTGMPNRFRISLKPIWRVHTEIGLVQTDLDPTHLTM